MSELAQFMTITAIAEVRDQDGNLISATPVELTGTFTPNAEPSQGETK